MSGRCCSSASACSSGCSTAATRSHAELGARLKCAALIGFWFGFGYFLTGLYWIAEAFLVEPWRHGWLIPFVMTALPGGMALFYAAAAALAMMLWRPGAARVFALAIAFGLAEYRPRPRADRAALEPRGLRARRNASHDAGGVHFRRLRLEPPRACYCSPAPSPSGRRKALASRGPTGTALVALFFSVALALGCVWGEARLASAGAATTGVRLRIVQANIDQANKWRPENSAEIFTDYLDLTKSGGGAQGLDGITLVIWPETAVPFLLADSPTRCSPSATCCRRARACSSARREWSTSATRKAVLIAERIYNSLLVIDDKGEILGGYDKIHLVPFGEYLPFQDFMESLGIMQLTGVRGGFSAGTGPRLLVDPGRAAGAAADLLRDHFSRRGHRQRAAAGLAPQRHQRCLVRHERRSLSAFPSSQLRAVEQGLPVVRAANTGISAMIDPYGRVLAELGLGERGVVDGFLPEASPTTTFVNVGTLDRNRGSRPCACRLARILLVACENQSGPTRNERNCGHLNIANASQRETCR